MAKENPTQDDVAQQWYEMGVHAESTDAAIACFKMAVLVDSNYADAYEGLGKALLEQGFAKDADECLKTAEKLRKGEPLEKKVEENFESSFKKEFEEKFRKNFEETFKKNFEEIFGRSFEEIFKRNFEEIFRINMGQERTEPTCFDAEDYHQQGLSLKNAKVKDEPEENRKSRLENAIELYETAIRLNPKNAWSYYDIGNCLLDLKRYFEAETYFRKALKINKAHGAIKGENVSRLYHGLGVSLHKQERYSEAIEEYQKANELAPYFWTFNDIGFCQLQLGEYREAEKNYKEAIKRAGEGTDAKATNWMYHHLAKALEKQGKQKEAKKMRAKEKELEKRTSDKLLEQRISEPGKQSDQIKDHAQHIPEEKQKSLFGKILKYIPLAAAGIAAFAGIDYLTGNQVMAEFGPAAYAVFMANGIATGALSAIAGFSIARLIHNPESSREGVYSGNSPYVHALIGAIAGGAGSAIGYHIEPGATVLFGGMASAIPTGYLFGYITRNWKPKKADEFSKKTKEAEKRFHRTG